LSLYTAITKYPSNGDPITGDATGAIERTTTGDATGDTTGDATGDTTGAVVGEAKIHGESKVKVYTRFSML
jgi:hypothetical protein